MDKYKENFLALTKNLKLSDEIAISTLNKKILVSAGDSESEIFVRNSLTEMLSKTFSEVSSEFLEGDEYSVEVIVGKIPSRSPAAKKVYIVWDAANFNITLEEPSENSTSQHPALLRLGSAYACGAVIKQAIEAESLGLGERYPIKLKYKDYFGSDLSFLDATTDLGDLSLAGLGATGSWCNDTLSLFDVKGKIKGFDKDHVSDGNLQRSKYFSNQVGKNKAFASAEIFLPKNKNLIFSPVPENIQGANAEDAKLIRKLICCVGTKTARRQIQDSCLPFQIFDCSTTDLSEILIFFGQLGPQAPCLSCIYLEDQAELGQLQDIANSLGVSIDDVKKGQIDKEAALKISATVKDVTIESMIGLEYDSFAKQLCGQGKLPAVDPTSLVKDYIAPLCHVSAIAGIFLAIEIVRRHYKNDFQSDWNYWKLNPWCAPIRKLAKRISVEENCAFHNKGLCSALEIWEEEQNFNLSKSELAP
jgi:molybdopterin/thiamine biosynthesis adenylyltransferase